MLWSLILACTVAAVGLAVWAVWEAVRGGREAPSTRSSRRSITASYGPGYHPVLNWRWEECYDGWWEPMSVQIRRMTTNIRRMEQAIGARLMPTLIWATLEMQRLGNAFKKSLVTEGENGHLTRGG